MDVLVDDEVVETRTISSTTDELIINLKIDLYSLWKKFQFRLKHSWDWRVEIYDAIMYGKVTSIEWGDYY